MDRKRVVMEVSDGSASNNLSIIPCCGVISEQQKNKTSFPLESDLVVVRLIVGGIGGEYFIRYNLVLFILYCERKLIDYFVSVIRCNHNDAKSPLFSMKDMR